MSRVSDFLAHITTIINQYGVTLNGPIEKFNRKLNIGSYYVTSSIGLILIEINLETFNANIKFLDVFQASKPKEDKIISFDDCPLFYKFQEAFNSDSDIFKAFIAQHDDDWTGKRYFGSLLELLSVSLVLRVTESPIHDIEKHDFVISYHTNQSCSKLWLLNTVLYLQFENLFEFEYSNYTINKTGDYQVLYNKVVDAYDIQQEVTNFEDLGKLTLMKLY